MNYSLPNFNKYRPKKIVLQIQKINDLFNNINYNTSNEDLNEIIKRIANKEQISTRQFSLVIFHISKIKTIIDNNIFKEQNNFIKKIFSKKLSFENFIQNLKDIYMNLDFISSDNLLIYIFQNILIMNTEKDVLLLKQLAIFILENSSYYKKNSDFILIIKDFIYSNKNLLDFLEEKFFIYITQNDDYNYFSIKYKIDPNISMYNEIIIKFLSNRIASILNMKKEILTKNSIELFNKYYTKLKMKKDIYYKILEYSTKSHLKIENYSNLWFENMLKIMGIPKNNSNWDGFPKRYIDTFNKWYNNKQLIKIFEIETDDPRRLKFWQKYIDYIKEIKFIPNVGQTIIMKFHTLDIVEFGEVGNACYIYENNYFNLEEINDKSGYKTVNIFKDKYDAKNVITHQGNWEFRLKSFLSEEGYKAEVFKVEKPKRYF